MAAHLPSGREEGAAEAHETVHPRLENPEKHLVPDVGALAGDPSVGIDEAVDAADASDGRVGEIPDDARDTIGCQGGRDIGEDQDVSRRDLDGELLDGFLSASLRGPDQSDSTRSEEHTSELQSLAYLVCRLLLEKKKR